MTEDKANAHAGMPSFGVSQFAVPVFQPVFGRMTKGNSPFGAWVVCVYQSEASLEPRLDRCNDLRLFFSIQIWRCSLQNGANSIGVNDGGCYGLVQN